MKKIIFMFLTLLLLVCIVGCSQTKDSDIHVVQDLSLIHIQMCIRDRCISAVKCDFDFTAYIKIPFYAVHIIFFYYFDTRCKDVYKRQTE